MASIESGSVKKPKSVRRGPVRLGAVSFLNTRPLVYGLTSRDDVKLRFGVPSALGDWLTEGKVDVALVPVIDLGRHWREWQIVSDACIGSDGPTLTVQVFSREPIEETRELHCDMDSHTSVVLARMVMAEVCGREPALVPLDANREGLCGCRSVLLIGDKVATTTMDGFPCRLDLGAAWKQMTGLPFVFAVWAARQGAKLGDLPAELSAARDAGVAAAEQIASHFAGQHGWPVELARTYVTRHMKYRLDARMRAGMDEYLRRADRMGVIAPIEQGRSGS